MAEDTLGSRFALVSCVGATLLRLRGALPAGLHPFAFSSVGELLVGALLLHQSGHTEVREGSRRYISKALLHSLLGWALQAAAHHFLRWDCATGPYTLVFAHVLGFARGVPRGPTFSLFGIPCSNKTFTYATSAQLLVSQGWRSVLAGAIGVATGALVRGNVLGLGSFLLPRRLVRLLTAITTKAPRAEVILPTEQWTPGAPAPAAAAPPGEAMRRASAAVRPSEEALEQLIAMGFDPQLAADALRATGNDVQNALATLL